MQTGREPALPNSEVGGNQGVAGVIRKELHMCKLDDLKYVEDLDHLRYDLSSKPVFVHDQHRWILSIIHWAQQQGFLDSPCSIACLDGHRDWEDYCCSTNRSSRDEMRRDSDRVTHNLLHQYLEVGDANDQWLLSALDFELIDKAILIGGQLQPFDDRPLWCNRTIVENSDESKLIVDDMYELLVLRTFKETGGEVKDIVLIEDFDLDNERRRWEVCCKEIASMESKNLCLTVDLDFFVNDLQHPKRSLWNEEDLSCFLSVEISSEPGGTIITTGDLIRSLVEKSAVVAIAVQENQFDCLANAQTAMHWANEYLGLRVPHTLISI